MANQHETHNGLSYDEKLTGTLAVKAGLAQMLKGGVIMDVVTPEQARHRRRSRRLRRHGAWNGCPPTSAATAAWPA
jgi:hypothetical protein